MKLLLAFSFLLFLSCKKDDDKIPTTATVTFDARGGSPEVVKVNMKFNDRVTLPAYPTRAGYDMIGWYWAKDTTLLFDYLYARVTGNIDLVARWTPGSGVRYAVTFDARGGQPVPQTQSVISGRSAQTPLEPYWVDAKVLNPFKGWYKDPELTQAFNFANDKITADITLYAKWTN